MLKKSKLYQNLINVYTEEEAIKECEKVLEGKNIYELYEIKPGEIVKRYNTLSYLGCDIEEYIKKLKSEICENPDLCVEIKDNIEIIKRIDNIEDLYLKLEKATIIMYHLNFDEIMGSWYKLEKNMILTLYIPSKIRIPDKIKSVIFRVDNHHADHEFPDSVETINFGMWYNEITVLPNNIKSVNFGVTYNQPTNLPNKITNVIFGSCFNQQIILPNSVTHIEFGYDFNQPIILPNSIVSVKFGNNFNQPIILPNSITSLIFGREFNQQIILQNGITNLIFGNNYNQLTVLPKSVTKIITCSIASKTCISEKKVIFKDTEIFKFQKIENQI